MAPDIDFGSTSAVKHLKHRLISKTESTVFTAAFAALVVALLVSLFLAQHFLIGTARYWDLLRVERYMRLCQMTLEAEARAKPSEESLQKLRDIGLYIDVYPPDQEIPQPNPRYVPAIESVEIWGYVRDAAGKPAAVLRISRHDINTRHIMRTVRLYTLVGAIGGTLLIALAGLVLRRTIIRRVRRISGEIAPHLPASSKLAEEDPLEQLEESVRTLLKTQADAAAQSQRLLDGHTELACIATPEGTIVDANTAYCRFFGKTREDLIGTSCLDLVKPEYRMDIVRHLRSLSRENPEANVVHSLTKVDGSTAWVRWHAFAVPGPDGRTKEIISFRTDITPQIATEERLDNLRRAFDQMQSLAETGSLTWDFAADRMEWTPETRRLLGVEPSAPASLDGLLTFVAPDDRETVRRLFHEAREQGREFQHEFGTVLPDGSLRVLQSRAEVLADPKTKLLNHLTCTLRDITALRDAEAATKRELRFREAIEQSMAAGIVVSDENGRNLLVNPAFCAMTGMNKEELVGATAPYPYWPEDEIPAIYKAFELAIHGKTPPAGFELTFRRKDGTRFDVLIKVAPLLDSDDKRLGWLAVVSDISPIQQTRRELANTETALRAQLAYRQAVEKSTTVGTIAIDLHGRPFAANDALCKMLGYSEEEFREFSPPYPYWPEKDREEIQRALALHMEGKGPPEGFQFRFQRKDGSPVDVLITAADLQEPGGKKIGMLSAITDISAIKDAERQLSITNERLRIAQDCMGLGIWDWNPDTDALFWDENSFAMFGHPKATSAKEVWKTVHGEQERERLTYELHRLIAAGGANGQDRLRIRWPDDSEHTILSTYVILRDQSGKANRVVGVNRDITTEVEEQQDLRNAQERLNAALEGARFGTFEHVVGVGDINWSPANYEINGVDPSVTEPAELFAAWKEVAGDFYPTLMAEMNALPVGKTSHSYKFTARPHGKEPRRVHVSVFIERNTQGHPVKLVGVTRRLD